MALVGIIDCGISNIRSVTNALNALNVDHRRVSARADLDGCTHLILPGDGAFPAGMQGLAAVGLDEGLRQAAAQGKYILGICLGMQLLAKEGTEYGSLSGLDLIPGRVVQMTPADPALPVPQIGWNHVQFSKPSRITRDLGDHSTYYFMHSYSYEDVDADYVAATFEYAGKEVAIIENENVFGFQFHPEKSQSTGLKILSRFTELK